jgi:adenylylsulfate kinase-like enzyme
MERDGVRFVEVYVRAPIEVLIDRDVKGLYRRALSGEIAHFTGISDPYEEPASPEVEVNSARESVSESSARILSRVLELTARRRRLRSRRRHRRSEPGAMRL